MQAGTQIHSLMLSEVPLRMHQRDVFVLPRTELPTEATDSMSKLFVDYVVGLLCQLDGIYGHVRYTLLGTSFAEFLGKTHPKFE